MTIHELAKHTGISIRALHYYDKIDLLKPCCIEENGYRKYNEESLKRLQQILFYKEMDLPLKQIKDIMSQSEFDPKSAIQNQMELLTAKRNRLNKLIEQMEQILEGRNSMDFSVFEHNELEEVMRNRFMKLEPEYQQSFIEAHGSIDAFIKRMMNNKDRIKESAVKYYGSLENYIETLKQAPMPKEGSGKLQLQLDHTLKNITTYKDGKVDAPEVQQLVLEWKEIAKQLFEMEDITEVFRQIYHGYMNSKEIIKYMDSIYGDGATVFVGKAMEYQDTLWNHQTKEVTSQ